jgi:hypothetical protein
MGNEEEENEKWNVYTPCLITTKVVVRKKYSEKTQPIFWTSDSQLLKWIKIRIRIRITGRPCYDSLYWEFLIH